MWIKVQLDQMQLELERLICRAKSGKFEVRGRKEKGEEGQVSDA